VVKNLPFAIDYTPQSSLKLLQEDFSWT